MKTQPEYNAEILALLAKLGLANGLPKGTK